MLSILRGSLTRRTLIVTAIAVTGVIVVATLVTYRYVFRKVEARGVLYLNQYVSERAKREERAFLQVRDSLNIARQAFLERWRAPDPPGYLERFDRLFMKYPDGAVRSRKEFGDNFKFPTVWVHKDRPLTSEFKRRILVLYDTTALFLPIWIHSLGSLYAITPDTANVGFEAALPDWVFTAAADWAQDSMDYVTLLTPKANPSRELKWLAPGYTDSATGQYFVTLALPVDVDGRHLATLGHDMPVSELFKKTIQTDVAGLTHMVLRESDGRVIAHPSMMKAIIERQGLFVVEDSKDPAFISLCHAVFAAKGREVSGFDPVSRSYYSATRLEEPAWIFASTMPQHVLQAQAYESTQWVLWAGLLSLCFELGVIALVLKRQIAAPMRTMLDATARLAAGESSVQLRVERQDELGQFASGFNEMVRRVAERDEALRLEKASLEARVDARTAELRESHERLTQSESRFRTAFHASPAIVCLFRASDLQLMDVNDAFVRASGYAAEDVVGKTLHELGFTTLKAFLEELRLSDTTIEREVTVRARSGREVTVFLSGTRIELAGDPQYLTAALDITNIKRAEQELVNALARERELSEMKSDFVSIVSHEFRTPLEIIMSSGDILDRYFDRLTPEQRQQHLGSIHEAVRRMDTLMGEVLLLSKAEAGKMACTPIELDLGAVCRRIIDEIRSATNDRNPIRYTTDVGDARAAIDENLLRHILTNLLSNGVKYSPPATPVDLTVQRDGETAIFSVIDRGCGIPLQDQDRVFQSFHRSWNARHLQGTGLGLAIVKRCVQLHGGTVTFVSTEHGSTFTVRLPTFGASPHIPS
jgi:PAS domain S-box-containing protein